MSVESIGDNDTATEILEGLWNEEYASDYKRFSELDAKTQSLYLQMTDQFRKNQLESLRDKPGINWKHHHKNKYEKEIEYLEKQMPDKNEMPYQYYLCKSKIEFVKSQQYMEKALEDVIRILPAYDAARHVIKACEHDKRSIEYEHKARMEHKRLRDQGIPVGPFAIQFIRGGIGVRLSIPL